MIITAKNIANKGVVKEIEDAMGGARYFRLSEKVKAENPVQKMPTMINRIIMLLDAFNMSGISGIARGVMIIREKRKTINKIGFEL